MEEIKYHPQTLYDYFLYIIYNILNFVNSPPIFTSPVREVTFIRHSSCTTALPQMKTQHLILICTVLIHSKICLYKSQHCSNTKPTLNKLSIKLSLSNGHISSKNQPCKHSFDICLALLLLFLSLFLRLIFSKTP